MSNGSDYNLPGCDGYTLFHDKGPTLTSETEKKKVKNLLIHDHTVW